MRLLSLHRYPVKSMLGEDLAETEVTSSGLAGDRAFALFEPSDKKIVSAKSAHKFPLIFRFRATLDNGAARITFPDGTSLPVTAPDIDARLTAALGREVRLVSDSPDRAVEMVDFDPEHPQHHTVRTFDLPATGFFDSRPIHLLTTATLATLRRLYPQGDFDVARFRPNFLIECEGGDFVENAWVGRTLAVGESVRLRIDKPCARCIMTTLPQGALPADHGILRTIARHNSGNIGALASVVAGGTIRRGDAIQLL